MNQLNPQLVTLLYVVGLFALMYFLLIRPQQVRQKKHQEMLRNLKVNDPVVTVGGIYGTIVKIKEDTVVLRVADNVRIEVLKNAIAQVRPREEEEK
ncbi:preprotein translocase subunit YajC [Desulfovirgula thermocuniculi]|uniref:preprotein translocase subunit YajC n=1 Tax=Desulfovirgula thermocuniculi TaxID=348842 RepID=UPI000423032A|nr:preprotein translocase subunit YajC [Desulfovirgula thermocuniculi]